MISIRKRAGRVSGRSPFAEKAWLTVASIFFYGYWNPVYVPLIIASILANFGIGSSLLKLRKSPEALRVVLVGGVCGNLALLAYFKYMDFFIMNINTTSSANLQPLHIVLPLGISFFTFTQISYLVDTYRGVAREYSLLNYGLFVTFFPHLLAGPIIHHKEMMPQFVREYIYIPLGGNRRKEPHVLFNILFSFFLIGLWHGAG